MMIRLSLNAFIFTLRIIEIAFQWNQRTLCCNDKLFLSCDKSIAPYSTTSSFISNTFFPSKFLHHLLKVEISAIKKDFYDLRWYSQVTRISPTSMTESIFYIHNSYIPVLLSNLVFVNSSFHTDKVVSTTFEFFACLGSIFGSCAQLLQSCWHICHSRSNFVVRKMDMFPLKVWASHDDMLYGLRFWDVGRTDGKSRHNNNNKKYLRSIGILWFLQEGFSFFL